MYTSPEVGVIGIGKYVSVKPFMGPLISGFGGMNGKIVIGVVIVSKTTE